MSALQQRQRLRANATLHSWHLGLLVSPRQFENGGRGPRGNAVGQIQGFNHPLDDYQRLELPAPP